MVSLRSNTGVSLQMARPAPPSRHALNGGAQAAGINKLTVCLAVFALAGCAAEPPATPRPDLVLLPAAAAAARTTLGSFDGQPELTGDSAVLQGPEKPGGGRSAIGARVVSGPAQALGLALDWQGAMDATLRQWLAAGTTRQ